MARTYDSSRRVEAAQRTREAIVEAAFRLHGKGVIDFESLAREADVSLASVRKHFPTREVLFEACTDFGMHVVTLPDVGLISSTADPEARTRMAVRQVYAFNEQLFGQHWTAFTHEQESAALTAVLARTEDLAGLIAGLVLEPWGLDEDVTLQVKGFVLGLLHPLAYRSLRRYGGLTPEQATAQTTATVLAYLRGMQRREASAK